MVAALIAASSLLGQVAFAAPELPKLPPIVREPQITYLDRSGRVIGVRGGRYAPPVNLASLPAYVPGAFVAIEDRRFYEHQGVDPLGIARALVYEAAAGEACVAYREPALVLAGQGVEAGRFPQVQAMSALMAAVAAEACGKPPA